MGHEADNARQCKALALSWERRRKKKKEKDEEIVLTNKRWFRRTAWIFHEETIGDAALKLGGTIDLLRSADRQTVERKEETR